MAKPVILVVEPDPEVLWAIKDDYSDSMRSLSVLQADSDATALRR